MVPSPILADRYNKSRALETTIEESEEYITIIEEIPPQFAGLADMVTLENAAAVATNVFGTSFALTFGINLALNGVMT